jgi:predicted nucleotidyltransferase component of viral defense system
MASIDKALSDRAAVEVFHLVLMRTLLSTSTEKAHITLKGGCNLRFFFQSKRYSEDIDLDIDTIAKHTLKKNVDKVLAGTLLARQLSAHALSVDAVSAPKQTDTTQRWKVQLKSARGTMLPTKMEFSRRASSGTAELATVDRALLDGYRLPPLQVRHYLLEAALRQKIVALADRDIAQARDVFDLDLLLTKTGGEAPRAHDLARELKAGRERALSIPYDEYIARVVAYLEPEEQSLYRTRGIWESIQLHVAESLDRMAAR